MKKQYILPSTTTVAFRSGFICQVASPAAGMTIGGNSGLGTGGEGDNIDPM